MRSIRTSTEAEHLRMEENRRLIRAAISEAGCSRPKEISLALAHVFKDDYQDYLWHGGKSVTEAQCTRFKRKLIHFNKKALARKDRVHRVIPNCHMGKWVNQVREEVVSQSRLRGFNADAVRENWHHLMANYAAYGRHPIKGSLIRGFTEEMGDYRLEEVIRNHKGLRIVVLIPLKEGQPPIMAVRGTKKSLYGNILDDLGPIVGSRAFGESKDLIREKLQEIADKHGPAVICGHSLGGAIAQLITAEFCDLTTQVDGETFSVIGSCKHYGAPGAGEDNLARFKEKQKAQLERFGDRNKVTRALGFRHKVDVIPLFGGSHLADVFFTYGHSKDYAGIGAVYTAHTDRRLMWHFNRLRIDEKPYTGKSLVGRVVKYIGEPFRWLLGILAQAFLLPIVKQEELAKTKIKALVHEIFGV